MNHRTRRAIPVVAGLLMLATGARGVRAQEPKPPPQLSSPPQQAVLVVPYVPQTEALCGGAVIAMIMRYWGARDVHAEDFAAYVDSSGAGIASDALIQAVRQPGWTAIAFKGDPADLERHLSLGRPIVTLIEVAPNRYHYVAVVARANDQVVYHDPAVGPNRLVSADRFDRAWEAADHWSLLLVPDEPAPARGRDSADAAYGDPTVRDSGVVVSSREKHEAAAATACEALLHRAVRLAREDELVAASRLLERGSRTCPHAALRHELAGIRFRQGRFRKAIELTERAVSVDPQDEYAWELLAASRFRSGDRTSALDAWNQVDGPAIDLITISGLARTRYAVVRRRLGMRPRDILTAEKLERGKRRLSALPSLTRSFVRYRPHVDGSVEVQAAVVEGSALPRSWLSWIALAARSLPERELVLSVSSPMGSGALWSASGRWWENRPRVGAGVESPEMLGLPGIVQVSGYWERQTYTQWAPQDVLVGESSPVVEDHRHGHIRASEWLTSDVRVGGFIGFDRWDDAPLRPALGGEAELRLVGDRIALQLAGGSWPRLDQEPGFWSVGLQAKWRSAALRRPTEWRARAAAQLVSTSAPLAQWPGAGTGHARTGLLRAHPLLDNGIIRTDRLARTLGHGGVEVTRWIWDRGLSAAGLALFIDAARTWKKLHTHPGGDAPLQVDVGGGVRFTLPERARLRVDLAFGLIDGSTAASVAWEAPWPDALSLAGGLRTR